jgi:hypothetical protein
MANLIVALNMNLGRRLFTLRVELGTIGDVFPSMERGGATVMHYKTRRVLVPVCIVRGCVMPNPPKAASSGDNRSVTARDVTGGVIVSGAGSTVTQRIQKVPMPSPQSVDIVA